MLGSLFQNFLSAPQGQQAMTQLQSQGYPPGQAQGLLQSAFPAAAQAMQRAMPGGSAAAASPDAPASLTDVGGSHYVTNFLAGAVSGLVRGNGLMGAAKDGLQGVVGGHVAQVIASRWGLPQRVAGTIGAGLTPLLIDFLWDKMRNGLDLGSLTGGGAATGPQMGAPTMGGPQMGAPSMGAPQMGAPGGAPQMGGFGVPAGGATHGGVMGQGMGGAIGSMMGGGGLVGMMTGGGSGGMGSAMTGAMTGGLGGVLGGLLGGLSPTGDAPAAPQMQAPMAPGAQVPQMPGMGGVPGMGGGMPTPQSMAGSVMGQLGSLFGGSATPSAPSAGGGLGGGAIGKIFDMMGDS